MTPQDLVAYYKTQVAAAAALGTVQSNIGTWLKAARVPYAWQLRAEEVSAGGLKADPEAWRSEIKLKEQRVA